MLPGKLILSGDINIKFMNKTLISQKELFRAQFNTAFIGSDNILQFDRTQVSPESLMKKKKKKLSE